MYINKMAQSRKKIARKTANSRCFKRKMSIVMREWKAGKLYSSSGAKVKNYKQAVAIGLSVARKSCEKKRRTTKRRKRSLFRQRR